MQKHTQNEKRENDKLSFFHRTINLANRHLNTLTCTQWITRSSTTKNIRQLFIIAFDTKWVHFYSETNKKQTKKVVILFSLFYFIALLFINFSPWLNKIRIIVGRPFAPFERLKIDNEKKNRLHFERRDVDACSFQFISTNQCELIHSMLHTCSSAFELNGAFFICCL